MKLSKPKLSYANVISTLALFLALGGGAAFAADKLRSNDIGRGAVGTSKLRQRAVTSGKLAIGAVRSNQIADGVLGSEQIGKGAVAPSNLEVPLSFVADPGGGSASIPGGQPEAYPLSDNSWIQRPGQVNLIAGVAAMTIANDGSFFPCETSFTLYLNGRRIAFNPGRTESPLLKQVEVAVGAEQAEVDPVAARTNELTAEIGSNGRCAPESTVDSTRFRVVALG